MRQLGQHFLWVVFCSIPREQQKRSRQPFFGGIKQLIHEVLLNSDVPGEHVRNETIRECVFAMKDAYHLTPLNYERLCRCDRDSCPNALGLACEASFTEEISRAEHRHHRLFAHFIYNAKFYAALLNVQNVVGRIALRIDDLVFLKLHDLSG